MVESAGEPQQRVAAPRERPRRWWAWVLGVVVVALGAGGGWWARGAALGESESQTGAGASGVVELAQVVQGSVGRSMTLGVAVRQPLQVVAHNQLSGVVTAVGGGSVNVGDVLYEVSGVPVVAVQGDVPFYRDIGASTVGEDVIQIQQALVDLGYLSGSPGERMGSEAVVAVRAWQRDLGVQSTGVVPLGQLVALPTLPATVSLSDEVTLSAPLSGGEQAVRAPTGEQDFVLVLAPNQESLVPLGAQVIVPFEDHEWEAVIASSARDSSSGQLEMELTAPNGGPVCGEQCASLPADESVSLLSTVVAVPPVHGLTMPAAALRSRPDGSTFVVDESGADQDVTVLGAGQGLVVIEGLEEGQQVRMPAGEQEPDQVVDPGSPTESETSGEGDDALGED